MNLPDVLYNDFDVEIVLGEVPRLMFNVTVKDSNPSTGSEKWLHYFESQLLGFVEIFLSIVFT
jgi:hypothetical protein